MIIRVLSGLVAAAALVAGVALADTIPVHSPAAATVSHESVAPLVQPVACPGPLQVPVGDVSSGDADLDSGSDDVLLSTFTTGSAADIDGGFASDAVVASTIERVGGGDIAGSAGVACVRPSLDQWLVGGATTLGASARLVLTNPAQAPVEVKVTAFGPIASDGEPIVIVVGPESQKSTLLEGIIPENPALVLHLESSGTGIVANIQDSRLDGFEPAGTDWVTRAAQPATSIVIPAVGPSTPDEDGGSASVSLLAPDGATVSLTLVTAQGIVEWPGTAGLVLDPGVVTVIAVPELEAGAIEVSADAPVVAAGVSRVSRGSQTGRDGSLAYDSMWVAGQLVTGVPTSLVAVADTPMLSVYSPTHQSMSVTNQDGVVVATVDVQARTVQLVSADAKAGDTLTVAPGFAWVEVVRLDDGFVTAIAPAVTALEDLDVAVTVGSYVP